MKRTDALVRLLLPSVENKRILEVTCGAADFSISASRFAKSVCCIDLDDSRLNGAILRPNIQFQIMDASKMDYPDDSFDTVVLYNAFFHIQSHWDEIARECKRVVKDEGSIYIVGTWKLDMNLIEHTFGSATKRQEGFLIAAMTK